MKKVLLAFDGTQFSEGAFEFARQLNERQPILLTGIFIPQLTIANMWSYAAAMSGVPYIPLVEEEDADMVYEHIRRFETLCRKNKIAYRVHKDFNDLALSEITRETRFADLLIISSEKFFYNLPEKDADAYRQQALHLAECPIIVVPEKFRFPQRNILAYDGSGTSVFAIKQFAYLFPELSANETLLVYIREGGDTLMPSEDHIKELASQHFRKLELVKLQMDPSRHFSRWISENKSSMLVCGAYSRSTVSQLLKRSFVTNVLSEHKLPVFIAHK